MTCVGVREWKSHSLACSAQVLVSGNRSMNPRLPCDPVGQSLCTHEPDRDRGSFAKQTYAASAPDFAPNYTERGPAPIFFRSISSTYIVVQLHECKIHGLSRWSVNIRGAPPTCLLLVYPIQTLRRDEMFHYLIFDECQGSKWPIYKPEDVSTLRSNGNGSLANNAQYDQGPC